MRERNSIPICLFPCRCYPKQFNFLPNRSAGCKLQTLKFVERKSTRERFCVVILLLFFYSLFPSDCRKNFVCSFVGSFDCLEMTRIEEGLNPKCKHRSKVL